jgi:type IV secretory pathway VirJ component
MKRIVLVIISILSAGNVFSQETNLPVIEWNGTSQNPFILYISGDGGFNRFSLDLCITLNKAGYSITAINAKTYFWNQKTPEQTAGDISGYLQKKFRDRKNQQLVLVGYSFGSDVIPFVVNRFPGPEKNKLLSVILLSPSASTDFEVHWLDMFGAGKKRSMDVVAEINKMGDQKTVTIFGSDETDFPVKKIKLKNHRNEVLPGGHHFAGDTDEVARTMIKYFK